GRAGRRALVAAEVALSVVLVIGAALLMTSFGRLARVNPGFDPTHAVTADIFVPIPGRFNPVTDGPRWSAFFSNLMTRMAEASGVAAVGAVSSLPLSGADETGGVGVRMALGAQASDVLRMVFWEGARLSGAGIVVGIVGAL